jgi:hypothetical protein
MKMTFQEIRIIATGPCIANQMRDVSTICRRSWCIAMGTNCALLLADLFLYSWESEFLQKLVKDKKIHEVRAFNFTYRYIDDVLSIKVFNLSCGRVVYRVEKSNVLIEDT